QEERDEKRREERQQEELAAGKGDERRRARRREGKAGECTRRQDAVLGTVPWQQRDGEPADREPEEQDAVARPRLPHFGCLRISSKRSSILARVSSEAYL